jgi:hypothetical protein
MDLSMWDLLRRTPESCSESQDTVASLTARLKNIIIVKAPETHAGFHPMASGLAREFKLRYLDFVLGLNDSMKNVGPPHEKVSFNTYLNFISESWSSVHESTITLSFDNMLKNLSQKWHKRFRKFRLLSAPMRPSNRRVLKTRSVEHPMMIRGFADMGDDDLLQEFRYALPGVPDTMIQYYLTQEADIGPSSFLRTRIQGMRHHEDFESCFASPHFGHVRHVGVVFDIQEMRRRILSFNSLVRMLLAMKGRRVKGRTVASTTRLSLPQPIRYERRAVNCS